MRVGCFEKRNYLSNYSNYSLEESCFLIRPPSESGTDRRWRTSRKRQGFLMHMAHGIFFLPILRFLSG